MKTSLRSSLLALALALSPSPRDAMACGGTYEGPVYINRHNPDLPLSRMREGHPGVIPAGSGWHRADRVVAWRALTGVPLSADEHAGWISLVRSTHPSANPREVDPDVTVDAPSEGPEGYDPDPTPWYRARSAVMGARGPDIANEWASRGAWAPNCLRDAFVSAVTVLEARRREYGHDELVRGWIDAQDAVFSNCGATPGRTPARLSDTAPALALSDRAWQIAASHFYAARFTEAERAFRAIAADASSPWSPLARYLVVRTIARAAHRDRERPDATELARAVREADAILADTRAQTLHAMTARYRGWLLARQDPAGRAHELGVALARSDEEFALRLRDYVSVLDVTAPDPFARQRNDADRLTAWIGVLENHPAAPDVTPRALAIENFQRSHAAVWLVAALIATGDPHDAAMAPIYQAAARVARDDPAYVSARYYRLRSLAAGGANVFDEVLAFERTLTDEDGPTARNLTRELAASCAPDVERFVAVAHGRAAGWDGSEGFITLPPSGDASAARDDLSPLGATALSSGVPLSVLLRAARVRSLPAAIHDRLVATTVLRATLLDDDHTRMAAMSLLSSVTEPVARAIRPVTQAPSREVRRVELLRALMRGAGAIDLAVNLGDAGYDPSNLWAQRCDRAIPEANPARFLTAAERAELTRERAQMAALGDGVTWFASEAARVAPTALRDAEMPAILASAIEQTRNNPCPRGAAIHAASRAAFVALHRYFPRSAEARASRYWY